MTSKDYLNSRIEQANAIVCDDCIQVYGKSGRLFEVRASVDNPEVIWEQPMHVPVYLQGTFISIVPQSRNSMQALADTILALSLDTDLEEQIPPLRRGGPIKSTSALDINA